MKHILFALRPKQWVKNTYIFLPLIFGKKLFNLPTTLETIAAFALFCLSSSTVYLINDIIDLAQDKLHPTKRLRPIASGKLGVPQAKVIASVLGIIALSMSFSLNFNFGLIVSVYIVFNFIYSKVLKNLVIIDIFCISVFFLLRIMAGSVIAHIGLSHWIIFMTVLLALFLGFLKRRQELKIHQGNARLHRKVLIKYNLNFIDQIVTVITSSIVIAYMLYAVDAKTVAEVGSKSLMFSIPLVYYGIFRYFYLIYKVHSDGDPTRILFSDRAMQLDIVLWVIVCVAVIYFGF